MSGSLGLGIDAFMNIEALATKLALDYGSGDVPTPRSAPNARALMSIRRRPLTKQIRNVQLSLVFCCRLWLFTRCSASCRSIIRTHAATRDTQSGTRKRPWSKSQFRTTKGWRRRPSARQAQIRRGQFLRRPMAGIYADVDSRDLQSAKAPVLPNDGRKIDFMLTNSFMPKPPCSCP